MRTDRPTPRPWRRALAGAAAIAILVTTAIAPSPASARTRPYLLGDSVVALSLSAIRNQFGDSIVIDALACRGAVSSCAMPGEARPQSGLSTLRAERGRLGDLVVIALGYNDRPQRRAIDRLMQELRDQGVRRVAWINLSERRSGYRDTNRALTAASFRWPELRVLDWRGYSAGRSSWFIDGVHLTAKGKLAFAHFLARSLARLG
jgi:hypothetical protein